MSTSTQIFEQGHDTQGLVEISEEILNECLNRCHRAAGRFITDGWTKVPEHLTVTMKAIESALTSLGEVTL